GFFGDVRERAIAVVTVEVAGRLLSLGKAFETAAVGQENVRPTIVVEIEESGAAAGGFDDVALGLVAPVFGFGSQAGALGDVDEVNFWRHRWWRGGCGMRLRGCE